MSLYIWSALHLPESEFGECIYPNCYSDNDAIPVKVRLCYREAEKIRFRSTNAYAVMGRRVLEAIVEERGIHNSSLFQAMSRLYMETTMPPYLVEAINWLRKAGNEGAHATGAKLEGVHNDMIASFLHAVIQHLYIFPGELRLFKYLLEPPEDAEADEWP